MELREFIAETLKQIIDAVVDAQKYAQGKGALVNPGHNECFFPQGDGAKSPINYHEATDSFEQTIQFDVAVTAKDGTGTKGGIGVVAGVFALGSHGQSQVENSSISRIKFDISVSLPGHKSTGERSKLRNPPLVL